MRRDNAALVLRLATPRYGYAGVAGSSCEVAWQVAGVLATRGWTSEFVRCPRCPAFVW